MEKYVTTLKQAIRLKELAACSKFPGNCPPYYIGELLEILPNEIDNGSHNFFLTKRGQLRGYSTVDGKHWLFCVQGTRTDAEAFGEVLIYLLEKNLIWKID